MTSASTAIVVGLGNASESVETTKKNASTARASDAPIRGDDRADHLSADLSR